MIQFSEGYNAQTIFDQVWESPSEWFSLIWSKILPTTVHEIEPDMFGANILASYVVTVEMIEDAVWKLFKEVISKRIHHAPNFADWVSDLDAEDVDAILQMAVFGEIRYE